MNTEKVFKRKRQLIERDPLYKDFLKTSEKITDIRIFEEIDRNWRVFDCNDKLRNKHEKKYPDHWKFNALQGELGLKWFINIDIDWSTRKETLKSYTNTEAIWIGHAPTVEGYEGVLLSDDEKYPQLEWLPYPNHFNKEPILAEINEFVNPGEKGRRSWLPILIDLRRLNKSSAKQLKKHIWEIIDVRIPNKQKITPSPPNEIPECSFLYSQRKGADKTFQNNLRFYDIHTQEKISFRLIAEIEKMRGENIANAERFLEKVRTVKMKVGHPVKGEDRIEKGIKLIWSAIHREPYSPVKVEPIIEDWNCPKHGKNYSEKCEHCIGLANRFDRIHSMNRGYKPPMDDILPVTDDALDPEALLIAKEEDTSF